MKDVKMTVCLFICRGPTVSKGVIKLTRYLFGVVKMGKLNVAIDDDNERMVNLLETLIKDH